MFCTSVDARRFSLYHISVYSVYLVVGLEGLSQCWALRAMIRWSFHPNPPFFDLSVYPLGRVLSFDKDQVHEGILDRLLTS